MNCSYRIYHIQTVNIHKEKQQVQRMRETEREKRRKQTDGRQK